MLLADTRRVCSGVRPAHSAVADFPPLVGLSAIGKLTSGLPVILKRTNTRTPSFAIRLRALGRHGSDCLLDFHDRVIVRLPRREVHLFTREQAIALRPVNFEVARLDLVDLDAADVASDT